MKLTFEPARATVAGVWYRLKHVLRQLWLRVAIFAFAAILTAIIAGPVGMLFDLPLGLPDQALQSLLSLLASSMLAVTTFSLSVMTAAHHAASSQATPRAHRLLREDGTTQNVLAVFLGSFVYAVTSLIFVETGLTSAGGEDITLIITVIVIGMIVFAIIRWVQHLSRLGSVEHSTEQVQRTTSASIASYVGAPRLGAGSMQDFPGGTEVTSESAGFIVNVDLADLQQLAEQNDLRIALRALPGDRVGPATVIAEIHGDPVDHALLRNSFVFDQLRSFDQDPGYGFSVMSEVGSRALSPGINDPGTAIDVIGRLAVLFLTLDQVEAAEVRWDRLHAPDLDLERLMTESFLPIARDGATLIEVQEALQQALEHLAEGSSPEMRQACITTARRALQHPQRALITAFDKQRLSNAAWAESAPS